MLDTNIHSNMIVYQKYKGASIKVGCATYSLYASSGFKAEGVPTNNQRQRGSGPCRLWGGLEKARHIVPTAFLVRVQCLKLTFRHINRRHICLNIKSIIVHPMLWMNVMLDFICICLRRAVIKGKWAQKSKRIIYASAGNRTNDPSLTSVSL